MNEFFSYFRRHENIVDQSDENKRQRRDLSSQTISLAKTHWLHKRSSNTSSAFPKPELFPQNTIVPADSPKPPVDDKISKMDPTNTYYTYVYSEVNASVFTLTLNNLKHYSYYSITVKACREGTGDICGMSYSD